jgi:hypothetical protein
MVTSAGSFKYETCLLKHHVRTTVWLPMAKERLGIIRATAKSEKAKRRLRYFTFCAVGAIDVLMLDLAHVVRRSDTGRFDTIFFFDKDQEHVAETMRRIPGAIGFVGDFVDTVLLADPDEATVVDSFDALEPPPTEFDELATREKQRHIAERREFIRSFPFDVLNLDLEEFLFKDRDEYPGRLLNALRKIFAWQRRPLVRPKHADVFLDSFTLFFTTQVGPPNLSNDYKERLEGNLTTNIAADSMLRDLLKDRTGDDDVPSIRGKDFDLFFKLAMPKMLAATLLEADWYVDPEAGISVVEFERESKDGPYKMLHLAMHVRRQDPPLERRGPREDAPAAADAYRIVVRRIISQPEEVISIQSIDTSKLKASLAEVFERRRSYYPEDESPEL